MVVNNIITLVNVALGAVPPSVCESGIPSGADVTIALIIQAVNNALEGCGTPLVDVSGTWREDLYSLVSSDCHSAWTTYWIEEVVANPLVCDYQLSQNGRLVTALVLCTGDVFTGTWDATGTLRNSNRLERAVDGCTITIDNSWMVSLRQSPTIISGPDRFEFSGSCGVLRNCTIVSQARWTKR